MGLCLSLVSGPSLAGRDPVARRNVRVGDLPHRRGSRLREDPAGPSGCLIDRNGDDLVYGREVPLHFEVAPRPVLFQDSAKSSRKSYLAVSRLEAMAEPGDSEDLCAGKALVIAAWPYSLGLIATCAFRRRLRAKQDGKNLTAGEIQAKLAAEHVGDLLGLLRAIDALAADPMLTRGDRLLASRFVLGEFVPTSFDLRTRSFRAASGHRDPGWVLGICDAAACEAILLSDRVQKRLIAAAERARRPKGFARDGDEWHGVAVQAAQLAARFALAGYAQPRDRDRAEDNSVVGYAAVIAGKLASTIASSRAAAQRDGMVAVGGGDEGSATLYDVALDDEAERRYSGGIVRSRSRKRPPRSDA